MFLRRCNFLRFTPLVTSIGKRPTHLICATAIVGNRIRAGAVSPLKPAYGVGSSEVTPAECRTSISGNKHNRINPTKFTDARGEGDKSANMQIRNKVNRATPSYAIR